MSFTRPAAGRALLRTVCGLFIVAAGVHLTIQANIGLSPWDALATGISYYTPLTYGTAHMTMSLLFVGVDLLLRENIGCGTVLDALLTGNFVDLIAATGLVPLQRGLGSGVALMVPGLFLMALGQFFYMSAGQGCGPRDAFVVALGRRMNRVPIGAVNTVVLCGALLGGWLLGAPIGVGTVLSTFGIGAAMQIVFRLLRFEPRRVVQRGLAETLRVLKAG